MQVQASQPPHALPFPFHFSPGCRSDGPPVSQTHCKVKCALRLDRRMTLRVVTVVTPLVSRHCWPASGETVSALFFFFYP